MVPATSAPALRASSSSSASDSRSAWHASTPGRCGILFSPTPTSSTRSGALVVCEVFIRCREWRCARGLLRRDVSGSLSCLRQLYPFGAARASRRFLDKPLLKKPENRSHDLRVIAESREPVHARLLAKPSELTLGISARGLLDRSHSFLEALFTLQMCAQFAVADKLEWLGRGRDLPCHKVPHFL